MCREVRKGGKAAEARASRLLLTFGCLWPRVFLCIVSLGLARGSGEGSMPCFGGGPVRQPCKPQTPKMSGLLALYFQPRASADEGLGPSGPLARG